jgi:hypothetical protein
MPLPTIILLEEHHDTKTSQCLAKMLNYLRQKGYKKLGLEVKANLNQNEIIELMTRTLNETEILLKLAAEKLKKPQEVVLNLSYLELFPLLSGISPKPNEFAYRIKAYLPFKFDLQNLHEWLRLGGSIHGMDSAKANPDKKEGELSLEEMNKFVKETLLQRDSDIVQNMLKDIMQGEGVIMRVGIAHAKGLVKNLKAHNQLANCLFICPHDLRWLNKDFKEDLATNIILQFAGNLDAPFIEGLVDTPENRDKYIERLKAEIERMCTAAPATLTFSSKVAGSAQAESKLDKPKSTQEDGLAFMKGAFSKRIPN